MSTQKTPAIQKQCLICFKSYLADGRGKHKSSYCSQECNSISRKQQDHKLKNRFSWKIARECLWCFQIFIPTTVKTGYCSEDCKRVAATHINRFGHVNYSTMPLCSCGRIATPPKGKRHYVKSQGRSKTCEICRAEKKKQVDINRASIKYRVRAEVMKRGVKIEVDNLVIRDGFDCQICHEPIDWSKRGSRRLSPSVDHIVPISKGGEHVYENCRMVHFGCNAKKGNR